MLFQQLLKQRLLTNHKYCIQCIHCSLWKEVHMKQKVINTRLDEDLYEKISAKAKKNRITISNLIRNLVEDSLEIGNDVLDLVDEKIKKRLHERDMDGIVGYQSIILAKDTVCDFCDKELTKGTHAHMAILEHSSKKLIVCDACKKEQEKEEAEKQEKAGK